MIVVEFVGADTPHPDDYALNLVTNLRDWWMASGLTPPICFPREILSNAYVSAPGDIPGVVFGRPVVWTYAGGNLYLLGDTHFARDGI